MTWTPRVDLSLVAYLAVFSGVADAFWRLPCRGRSGIARMDPLMSPGEPSYHVHSVHGSSSFAMKADDASLQAGDCTSCAVKQDRSAYWHPALYFLHSNGTAELATEAGGMLAYYLLYGENIKAFPPDFRMLAGDTFQRNFTWPIPDPPKSLWFGDQSSQAALRQKAIGFNCLNYDKPGEASLYRHYLPKKSFLDLFCPDGLRFEVMFPSCWNGKDVDSEDHKSHVAYPSLVMDGTCPEGYEHRLVSLFYETIWNTQEFKDYDGEFVLANGDPTGFGYHGDFMQGWEPGVLQQAINKCTNPSGQVEDCPVFHLQSEDDQRKCKFEVPDVLKDENVYSHHGLPNGVKIEDGPEYAFPIKYTTPAAPSTPSTPSTPTSTPTLGLDLGLSLGIFLPEDTPTSSPTPSSPTTTSTSTPTPTPTPATTSTSTSTSTPTPTPTPPTTTSTSTPTPTPTPVTSYIEGPVTKLIVHVQRELIVECDDQGTTYSTVTGDLKTISTETATFTKVVSTQVTMETPTAPVQPRDMGHVHRRHGHGHGHLHRRGNMI